MQHPHFNNSSTKSFTYAFVNDILVVSETQAKHLQHLKTLFKQFQEYGISFKPSKCVFGESTIRVPWIQCVSNDRLQSHNYADFFTYTTSIDILFLKQHLSSIRLSNFYEASRITKERVNHRPKAGLKIALFNGLNQQTNSFLLQKRPWPRHHFFIILYLVLN